MIITDGNHTVRITIRIWNDGIGYGEDLSNDIFEDVPSNGVNEEESDRIGFDVYNVNDVSYCIDYATDFAKSINEVGPNDKMNVFVQDISKKESTRSGYLYIEKSKNKNYCHIYLIYSNSHNEDKLKKAKQFISSYEVRDNCFNPDRKIEDYNIFHSVVPAQFANIFMNGYNDTATKLFKRLGFEVVFENPFKKNV